MVGARRRLVVERRRGSARPRSVRPFPAGSARLAADGGVATASSSPRPSATRSAKWASSRTLPGQACRRRCSRCTAAVGSGGGRPKRSCGAAQEMGEEQRARPSRRSRKRRQPQGHDVEAKVEVLAEVAPRLGIAEVHLGRGDHAQVDPAGLVGAERRDLARLEHAQQLHLQRGRHRPRSRRGTACRRCACSIRPTRRRSAPVKAPASWPNSSLSSTVSGSAPQFSATNGRSAPPAPAVQRARPPPPCRCRSRPGSSTSTSASATWRTTSRRRRMAGRLAEQRQVGGGVGRGVAQAAVLHHQAALLGGAHQRADQPVAGVGLGDEVVGARPSAPPPPCRCRRGR